MPNSALPARERSPLTIHQQRPAQQRAAMRLVSTGYVTVATIMGLENVLDYIEGFKASFNRDRGRDPGLYYLRVFGEPGEQGLWGWRFGGHHISLNNLIVDGVLVATTPCFLGANPATSPLLGGAVNRPLARVEDLGRDLVRSLRPQLAARAILLPKAPSDFVTINLTYLSSGNRVIPFAAMYRDERFSDPLEEAKLQSLANAISAHTDLSDADQEAVAYSSPRAYRLPNSMPSSESSCGPSLPPTWTGRRRGPPRYTVTTTRRLWMPCTSPGLDRRALASRTITGYRARGS
jgi:hypothetical protein